MPGHASCASRWVRPRSSSMCCRACGALLRDGGKFQTARELAEQCLHLAQRAHDPALSRRSPPGPRGNLRHRWASSSLPAPTWSRGSPSTTPSSTAPMPLLYGHDPGVVCLVHAALTLWMLGYPDQALAQQPRGAHPGPRSCRTRSAWRSRPGFCALAPSAAVGRPRPSRSGRRQPSTLATEQDLRIGKRLGRSLGAGRWPSRATVTQGWPRYTGAGRLRATEPGLSWPYLLAATGRGLRRTWDKRRGAHGAG